MSTILAGGLIVACSSGGGSSGGGAPATTATELNLPAGSTTFGSTSPVAFNLDSGTISFPGTNGYTTYTMPEELVTLLDSNKGAISNGGTVSSTANSVTVTFKDDKNNIRGAVINVAEVAATSSKADTAGQVTYWEFGVPSYNQVTTEYLSENNMLVFGGTVTTEGTTANKIYYIIKPNTGTIATPSDVNLDQCPGAGSSNDSVTSVATTPINEVQYIGVGTSTGNVCVFPMDGSTLGAGTNLASQAPQGRYTAGSVDNVAYTLLNNNAFGYWQVATSNDGYNIYRVTATTTSSAQNPLNPQSFWNTTLNNQQQTSNVSWSKITFTGAPSATDINEIYSDGRNNLYVGTKTGSVFKLANGYTAWTHIKLNSNGGAVTLTPTPNNVGTVATIPTDTTPKIYVVN